MTLPRIKGITGVVGSYQILQSTGALPEVRELVTGDVNAAIAGAKEAGATTIWVNEDHSVRDLLPEKIDPVTEVLLGKPKPLQTGNLEGVAVKVGASRFAARCAHSTRARVAIREGAARAVHEIARFKPFTLPSPMQLGIDCVNPALADCASWIPTAVRDCPTTVSFTVPDFLVGMRTFFVAAALPYQAADPIY